MKKNSVAYEILRVRLALALHYIFFLFTTERRKLMTVKSPKELFVFLLSNVRNGVQRETSIYQELSQQVQDPDIKEAIDARVFLTEKTLSTLDECFRLIGEQPMKSTGRLQEIFVEEFRKELNEIQGPIAKHLYIL